MNLLSSPAWTNLVVTLLHSLWLGVVWMLVLGFALRVCGNDPAWRYRAGLSALAGLVVSVFVAWSIQSGDWEKARQSVTLNPSASAISEQSEPATVVSTHRAVGPSASWTAVLGICWAIGCAVMLARVFLRIGVAERIRRESQLLKDGPIVDLLRELQAITGCDRLVRIASSSAVLAPSVVGVLSPLILLPVSMLSGVSAEHLRAILLHELAHIRRHDYLVNLVQQLIEAFLFFNPAVWWINRQIRLEREACCDLVAVKASSEHSYASALAAFAATVHRDQFGLQPAFPGDREPSSLLVAGYRPVVRLPWHSSFAVLFCAGVFLFGAWRGTRFAVALASEFLAAERRIEKIANLRAEVGLIERTYSNRDNVVVEGRIRTEDGAPLPKGVVLSIHVAGPNGNYGFGGVSLTNGQFRWESKYGDITLCAWNATNYGPAFLGPLRPEPGGAMTNIEMVLPKGFTSKIKVINPAGQPLAGAQLEGLYKSPNGSVPIKVNTDPSGMATIEHVVDHSMSWSAQLSGFQHATREYVRLSPDTPLIWELRPAKPATGVVVSKVTGKPVAGARLKLLYRSGGSVSADLNSAPTVAITDQAGAFRLNSLPDGALHIIAVQAEGHATKLVRDVQAGQSGIRVEIGPDIYITGRIEGDLSQLGRMPDPVIAVANPVHLNDSSTHSFNRAVPVSITNGIATFAVSNLWEGEVTIDAGGRTFAYILRQPKTDLVLSLPVQRQPEVINRAIIVRFKQPPGAPPVQGQLGVTRASPEEPGSYREEFFPIENGEARFDAPVGTWISWSTRAVLGYWTSENAHTPIVAGDAAMVIEAPALPAGALHGVVRNADGSDASGVMISVAEAKAAPGKNAGMLGDVGKNRATPNDGPTRFIAQPLPLGGKYVLIAHRGNQFVASEPIALSEEEPIREIHLKFVEGETLAGFITDGSGKPLANVPVSLEYKTPHSHSFQIIPPDRLKTDSEGSYRIPNINRQMPGQYHIVIDRANGYQPISRAVVFGQLLRIALSPAKRVMGVVVSDATGQPLAGVHFHALAAEMKPGDILNLVESDAPSDAKGFFEFSRLASREYNLYSRDGEIVGPNKRLWKNQERQTIRLKPHPGARIWQQGELVSAQP